MNFLNFCKAQKYASLSGFGLDDWSNFQELSPNMGWFWKIWKLSFRFKYKLLGEKVPKMLKLSLFECFGTKFSFLIASLGLHKAQNSVFLLKSELFWIWIPNFELFIVFCLEVKLLEVSTPKNAKNLSLLELICSKFCF